MTTLDESKKDRITLNELKKILYGDRKPPKNMIFITTFFPSELYCNSDDKYNINLIDSDYKAVGGWLSHLMSRTQDSRSGVERVRKQMLSIILNKPQICNEIQNKCHDFILQYSPNQNSFINLINKDSEIDKEFSDYLKESISRCFAHGLTLLLLYATFPGNVVTLTNLPYWKNLFSINNVSLSRSQYDIIISLQKQLGILINTIKNSCGIDKEYDNCCLDSLNDFEYSLNTHFLDIPPDIYQYYDYLLGMGKSIYFKLFDCSTSSDNPPDVFALTLQKIIDFQQLYFSFCHELNKIIVNQNDHT